MLTTLGMTLSITSAKDSGSPACTPGLLSETAAISAGRRLRQNAMVFSEISTAGGGSRRHLYAGGGETKNAGRERLILFPLFHVSHRNGGPGQKPGSDPLPLYGQPG